MMMEVLLIVRISVSILTTFCIRLHGTKEVSGPEKVRISPRCKLGDGVSTPDMHWLLFCFLFPCATVSSCEQVL